MIPISELARLARTTPRAVRIYHQRGLLPEPGRARNGYRQYGPDDVLRLIRIRRLRELGLPLGRIRELLSMSDDQLRGELKELDGELAARQTEIQRQRDLLAEIARLGGDISLPPELAELYAEAEAAGYPTATLRVEKDAILLLLALDTSSLSDVVSYYRRAIDDPVVLGQTIEYEQLADADPDDPRVADLARRMVAQAIAELADLDPDGVGIDDPDLPPAAELLSQLIQSRAAPAQQRVNRLVWEGMHEALSTK